MTSFQHLVFIATAAFGAVYFLFRQRTVDLLAVAFASALFYFLPMFVGVLPVLHGQGILEGEWTTMTPASYLAAATVLLALLAVAGLKDSLTPAGAIDLDRWRSAPSLAGYYNTASIIGLCVAIWSAPETIFTTDKNVVLANIGYGYVLFETAAGMALIDAAIHRRRVQLLLATVLLLANLLIGFRLMVLMGAIALMFIALASAGPLRAYRKLPTYGALVVCLFFALLLVHHVRYRLLGPVDEPMFAEVVRVPQAPVASKPGPPPEGREERPPPRFALPSLPPILYHEDGTPTAFFNTLIRIEPFTTQSILNEILRHDHACSLKLGAGKLLLVFSPFGRLLEGHYGAFEDEFKARLFPTVKFGMAANVWAEAYCRLGAAGVVGLSLAFVAGLVLLDRMIRRLPGILAPPLLLSGGLLAFYIHRNDLYYELLLIRRTAIVFLLAGAAYLAVSWAKRQQLMPIP